MLSLVWPGKKNEFRGNLNSEQFLRYIETYVVKPLGAGGWLVLDNCQCHKEFVQKVEDHTCDWIHNFIVERESTEGNVLFDAYHKTLEGIQGNKRKYKTALVKWLRERKLRDMQL